MKIAWAVFFALILGAAPARAVLGEYENSVASDQKVMRGEVRTMAGEGFSLLQITAAHGAVVKEYVSPDGRVFGISWQGPTLPNLEQLLGSYFTEFQQASERQVRKRGPVVVRTDRVVIESSGHMRSFHGRAFVPSLMPKNLSAEVVR